MRVHGATHVEEKEHLNRIVALRHHLDIQQAGVARGGADGIVQVQLVGGSGAGEFAQAAQGNLDIAGAQLDTVIEILEVALFPDLDRLLVLAVGPYTNAFRVVTLLAKG